jgi:SAM-dependent methyltransferase
VISPAASCAHHDPWQRPLVLSDLTGQDIWWLRRRMLKRLWPSPGGLHVIEVGSGPAHDSLVFAEGGADVTAVDCSADGLALGRRFYGELGLPLRTVQADIRRLPLEDGSFDVAFNAGVLEHFEDADLLAVLAEMVRVVRPGGRVLVFCPNRYNLFYQTHLRRIPRHDYEFERALTADEMRRHFQALGLVDIQVNGVHVHPAPNYLLPAWLPKHHRLEPWCRWCFAWLENRPGWGRFKSLIGQDFVVWAAVGAEATRLGRPS